jgi:hypothetical protein
MAAGVVSGTWGYTPNQVAGFDKRLEYEKTPSTYQLSLTSRGGPGKFTKFGETECESFNRLKKTCTGELLPVNPIFVGKKPPPPPQSEYSYSDYSNKDFSYSNKKTPSEYSNKKPPSEYSGVNSDGIKFIKFNNRTFKKGDQGKINKDESAQIIKIGPKQIIFLLKNNKERRLKINQFIEYNK